MADAGVGETEAAKGASEAKGAAEATTATAAEAGAAEGTAALTAGDIAAGAAGLSDAAIAADLGATAGVLGPSTTAALGEAGLAEAGAGALGGAGIGGLDTINITAPAAGGGFSLSDLLLPAAGSAPLATAAFAPGQTPATQGPGQKLAPPVGGVPDLSSLGGGADPGTIPGADPGMGGIAPPASEAGPYQMPDSAAPDENFWDWLQHPKNALTATSLGLTARNALFPPQLPGAARSALSGAGAGAKNAEMILQTGGMGSPLWTAQKASIDSMIDKEIQNQTAAMQQTLANAGAGGKDSGIVQEEIATLTSNLNVQRQALYRQALEQNVQNAVAELSGADATLMAIAQMQLAQEQEAWQLAMSGANLAARLQQLQG